MVCRPHTRTLKTLLILSTTTSTNISTSIEALAKGRGQVKGTMKNSPFYQPALKGKECPVICRNKPLSCTEVQLSAQAKDTLHSCLENDSFLLCALHVFRLGNDIESGLFPVLYILHTFTTKSLTQSTAKHLNVHILTTTYYCKNSH